MLPKLPAPHLVVRDFLSPDEHSTLLTWTIAQEARFESRNLSEAGVETVRKYKLDDLGPSASVFSHRIRAAYADWIRQLRISPFSLGRLELRIGAYPDGTHFGFHLDATLDKHSPESTRRLTAVYYYYREPRLFSGGDIRLYNIGAEPDSSDRIAIPPDQNTLVVFPSWIGHDVTPIRVPTHDFADSRFAVNCWLHQAP